MKRVGITGVTGLVGRRLAMELRRWGNHVVGFTRSERPLDVADEARVLASHDFKGIDVLVHLAGEPVFGRWTPEKRQRIRESRVGGTRAVVQALSALSPEERPRALVCASAIGYYGDRRDDMLTESSAPGKGFLAEVAQEWEAAALEAAELGMRVVRARIGVVLAPEGGAAAIWKRIFDLGLGGRLGNGRQWVSWVEIRDLISMLMEAVDAEDLQGPVNFVSPNPVRNGELTQAIGWVLSRSSALPAPAFALRWVLGGMEEMLLQSQRVEPAVLRSRKFSWKEPGIERALRNAFGKR